MKFVKKFFSSNLREILVSVTVFIYFIVNLLCGFQKGITTASIFHLNLIVCSVISFLKLKLKINKFILFLILVVIPLGVSNVFLVDNLRLLQVALVSVSLYIAHLFIEKNSFLPKTYLFVFYFYVAVILAKFCIYGISTNIFDGSSNNYVSIYILAPLLLYYITSEDNNKKVSVFPTICAILLCFFSGGRGGVIVMCLLGLGVIIYNQLSYSNSKYNKIKCFVLSLLYMIIITFLGLIVANTMTNLRLVSQLNKNGLEDNGRFVVWVEYIQSLVDFQYFVLGAPIKKLYLASLYEGNLHNSFFTFHANWGICGILMLLYVFVYDVYFAVKYKRWLYLLALFCFFLRSFTDLVFACNRMSPIALAIFVFPLLEKRYINCS